jgi:glucokinase
MTILLAGDIGGTKTILRLVRPEKPQTTQGLPVLKTLDQQEYASAKFPDLVPMVQQFLATAQDNLGSLPVISKACFGIAGPVINNICELTNLKWSLQGNRLQEELNIPHVSLINDFAAIGYGVLGLSEQDLYTLQSGERDSHAPIAILGAGTGLGEAFLIPYPDGSYRVFPTEGSHADFAPRTPIEFQLLTYLLRGNHLDRISVEKIVSGMGITSIYQFLCDREPSLETPKLAALTETWLAELDKPEKTVDLAAEISQAALTRKDDLCEQTMQLFVEAYGAEAGNFALKLLPYGGLYVAGGIAPKILPLLQRGNFLQAFLAKGRMTPILQRIPVKIVLNPQVGLIGAALFAAKL